MYLFPVLCIKTHTKCVVCIILFLRGVYISVDNITFKRLQCYFCTFVFYYPVNFLKLFTAINDVQLGCSMSPSQLSIKKLSRQSRSEVIGTFDKALWLYCGYGKLRHNLPELGLPGHGPRVIITYYV